MKGFSRETTFVGERFVRWWGKINGDLHNFSFIKAPPAVLVPHVNDTSTSCFPSYQWVIKRRCRRKSTSTRPAIKQIIISSVVVKFPSFSHRDVIKGFMKHPFCETRFRVRTYWRLPNDSPSLWLPLFQTRISNKRSCALGRAILTICLAFGSLMKTRHHKK